MLLAWLSAQKRVGEKMVLEAFQNYPLKAQTKLMELYHLIHEVAKKTDGVGKLDESLKWGEFTFSTNESKSGSSIRIDWKHKDPEKLYIYFNCQTKLISIFKEIYPDDFVYSGNRAISLELKKRIPKKKLSKCIEMALTYNLRKYNRFFHT